MGVRLKEDLDHRYAVQRLRLDMLDVVDQRSERSFGLENDAVRHVLRIESLIIPDDAHDRNIDVGQDIGGRVEDDERTQNQQQQSDNHECVGPSKGESDNPHSFLRVNSTLTPMPARSTQHGAYKQLSSSPSSIPEARCQPRDPERRSVSYLIQRLR